MVTVSEFYASLAAFRMYGIDLVVIVRVLCFRKINMMMMMMLMTPTTALASEKRRLCKTATYSECRERIEDSLI